MKGRYESVPRPEGDFLGIYAGTNSKCATKTVPAKNLMVPAVNTNPAISLRCPLQGGVVGNVLTVLGEATYMQPLAPRNTPAPIENPSD